MGAFLPEDLEESTIDKMATNEEGWTVPWAMWVDLRRRLWLHPKYTIHPQPGGTVQMLVRKTEDGYEVSIAQCGNHRWEPTQSPGYVSPADTQWIPVQVLHR